MTTPDSRGSAVPIYVAGGPLDLYTSRWPRRSRGRSAAATSDGLDEDECPPAGSAGGGADAGEALRRYVRGQVVRLWLGEAVAFLAQQALGDQEPAARGEGR
jgi:hypothetical protein